MSLREPQTNGREATLNRDADGNPLGICLTLNVEELRSLDVDVDDSDSVTYAVVDGQLRLRGE